MATKIITMNVSIPSGYKEFIKFRMERAGFCNASEYIRHLIREDHKRADTEEIEQLLKEGLASGPATPWTKDDAEGVRRRMRASASSRRRKSA
jgi:antitoxin ParD1/3/4